MKEKPQMRCASALQHIIRLQTKDRGKRARKKKGGRGERERGGTQKKAISPQEI